jgi:predicted Rossmann-fold nucleotide-binding protein
LRLKQKKPGTRATLAYFEVQTWAQLGEHAKPCGLLNAGGYYDPLIALFDHMVKEGFLSEKHRAMILVEAEPQPLLEAFARYEPPAVPRWIDSSET